MKERLRSFDWVLFALIFICMVISLVTLASVDSFFFQRQAVWYVVAILVILFGSQISWEWLLTQKWFRYGLYWGSVGLLILTHIQPHVIRGTKSWIVIGGFQFEPSEFAKIGLILLLAGFFSRRHLAAWHGKNIGLSLVYALIPVGLTALQPDLGSALVMMGIWVGFLLMSGIHKKRFFIGLFLIVLLISLAWSFMLYPYQKERIVGFLTPEADPLGINYNLIQSKIAIGSAGWWGKGFAGGTQSQLGFLPEAHTDFIFAAFVEEWGIVGGIVLILTYLGILLRITTTGVQLHRNDLKFVVLGTGLFFLIHFLINIGFNLGLVPVIGIGLPFISYGGSHLLTSAVLISIIERIKSKSSQ